MRTSPAASPPPNPADVRVIEEFIDLSWMERGLAPATLSAYRSDLSLFSRWLSHRGRELEKARRLDVLDFLSAHAHWPPRTIARRLSALRRFYQHLEREGRVATNPCDRCAQTRAPPARSPDRAGGGAAARRARCRHGTRDTGSRDAGGTVRDGAAGIGARGPASGAGESAAGRIAGRRQGRQGAARAPRRTGCRLAGTIPGTWPHPDSRGQGERCDVSHRSRWRNDPAGVLVSSSAMPSARESRDPSRPTRCGMHSRPTSSITARICVWSRCCSGTAIFPPPRYTRTSRVNVSRSFTPGTTHEAEDDRRVWFGSVNVRFRELIVTGAVRIILRSGLRGMAQSGSAPALGAGCRGFKSLCPDQ